MVNPKLNRYCILGLISKEFAYTTGVHFVDLYSSDSGQTVPDALTVLGSGEGRKVKR